MSEFLGLHFVGGNLENYLLSSGSEIFLQKHNVGLNSFLRWLYPFKAFFSSLEHIWANISFLERVL